MALSRNLEGTYNQKKIMKDKLNNIFNTNFYYIEVPVSNANNLGTAFMIEIWFLIYKDTTAATNKYMC